MRIPERYRLGDEDKGFMYLMQNFQTERLIGCVSVLSGAFKALDFSVAYGRDRMAFGKPIIKRELWQHTFVDLYTKCEGAKAFVYKCADSYNSDKYEAKGQVSMETVKLISMAKVLVGDVVSEVMDSCLQFHGGWGYIEEYPIARAWRDARLFRIGGGTTETMRYYIAKLMGL
jgi:citronellyl-CoA dehydrogenase